MSAKLKKIYWTTFAAILTSAALSTLAWAACTCIYFGGRLICKCT